MTGEVRDRPVEMSLTVAEVRSKTTATTRSGNRLPDYEITRLPILQSA